MKLYIFEADTHCEPCTKSITATLPTPDGYDAHNEYSWDSDAYPKGPYWSGDSYSDTPDHCGTCGLFLENPLTPDGYRYIVWESINAEWDAFYGIEREA